MVSAAQMSCYCDLDSIICILLHLLINYISLKYHVDGALQTEMRQQIAWER